MHAWVGGAGGGDCDAGLSALVTQGHLPASLLADLKTNALFRLKAAWRNFVTEVPKYCSEDAPVAECMWTCVENVETNVEAIALLELSGVYKADVGAANFSIIAKVAFCEVTLWPGDMNEASAPSEAAFWPIHPTIERLLLLKDLANPFIDHSWLSSPSDKVCLRPTSSCLGHNAYDLTVFKATIQTAKGKYKKVHLTNLEVRAAMRPTSSDFFGLPYVYNHFKWPHCDALGITFPTVA